MCGLWYFTGTVFCGAGYGRADPRTEGAIRSLGVAHPGAEAGSTTDAPGYEYKVKKKSAGLFCPFSVKVSGSINDILVIVLLVV